MSDVFNIYIASVIIIYGRLVDEVEATDNIMSVANLAFRELHEILIDSFDLDAYSTPDHVILAMQAHYREHGGEATARKLLDEVDVEHVRSACHDILSAYHASR